ncbi:MAG: addiction module protein [Planctomycetota bacterium]
MSKTAKALLSEALTLPESDRFALVSGILASVDGPPDADWEKAWLNELDRRVHAAERREIRGADWADVRSRILARLSAR